MTIRAEDIQEAEERIFANAQIGGQDARATHDFLCIAAAADKQALENYVVQYVQRLNKMIGPFEATSLSTLAVALRHMFVVGAVAGKKEEKNNG